MSTKEIPNLDSNLVHLFPVSPMWKAYLFPSTSFQAFPGVLHLRSSALPRVATRLVSRIAVDWWILTTAVMGPVSAPGTERGGGEEMR